MKHSKSAQERNSTKRQESRIARREARKARAIAMRSARVDGARDLPMLPAVKVGATKATAGNAWRHVSKPECHAGNIRILTVGGAGLFVGGWTRGASPRRAWAVLDLSGEHRPASFSDVKALTPSARSAFSNTLATMRPEDAAGPWLSLPVNDFGIPTWNTEAWAALVNDVRRLMDGGTDVMIACTGGHGRTGMIASIVAYLLDPETVGADPVAWIRKVYCAGSVETDQQERYVFQTLHLSEPGYLTAGNRADAAHYDDLWSGYFPEERETKLNTTDIAARYIFGDGLVYDEMKDGSFRTHANRLLAPKVAGVNTIFCSDKFADEIAKRATETPKTLTEAEVDALADQTLARMRGVVLDMDDPKCPHCHGLSYVEDNHGEAHLCPMCEGMGTACGDDYVLSAGR